MNRNSARGYIASSKFRNNRVPQHIQNQIVRLYCEQNKLQYVLSRAEYAIGNHDICQIWAALHEGYPHIVAYSMMQLPLDTERRKEIVLFAVKRNIQLHFACERMVITDVQSYQEIDIILKVQDAIDLYENKDFDLCNLKKILSKGKDQKSS